MYAKNDEVIWSFCNKCRKHLLCDVEIIKLGNLFPKKKINSFLSKISYLKIYKLFTIEDENRTVKMTISSAWGDSVNGEVRNIVKSSLCVDDGVQRCEAKRNELFWSFRQSKISSFCKPKPCHFGISVIFFLQIVEGTVGRYVHISTTHHANVALTRSIYLVTNVVRVSHMQLPKQHQPNINEAKLKKSVIQNEKTLEKRPS